jgi:hypothetical protein
MLLPGFHQRGGPGRGPPCHCLEMESENVKATTHATETGLGTSCVGPLAVLDGPAKVYDSNSREHPTPPPIFMCAKAGMTSCWSGLRICCPSKRQRPQLTLRLPSCRSRLASSSFVPLLIIILWVLVSFFFLFPSRSFFFGFFRVLLFPCSCRSRRLQERERTLAIFGHYCHFISRHTNIRAGSTIEDPYSRPIDFILERNHTRPEQPLHPFVYAMTHFASFSRPGVLERPFSVARATNPVYVS